MHTDPRAFFFGKFGIWLSGGLPGFCCRRITVGAYEAEGQRVQKTGRRITRKSFSVLTLQ